MREGHFVLLISEKRCAVETHQVALSYYVNVKNIVGIDGDVATVYVWSAQEKHNLKCLVDTNDLVIIDQIPGTWYANPARAPKGKYYVEAKVWDRVGKASRTVLMHRLIVGVFERSTKVDHRDNDGLNNRRDNLRTCNHQQNHRFRQPDKDWDAYDVRKAVRDEYRQERLIAKAVAEEFGLTRMALYNIRTMRVLVSPASKEYRKRLKVAKLRSLGDLKLAHQSDGAKFGVAKNGQR